MDKEKILTLVSRIYKALDTVSVSGYANTKTLSNCMEALQQLADDVNSLPIDTDNTPNIGRKTPNVTPVNPDKLRPK